MPWTPGSPLLLLSKEASADARGRAGDVAHVPQLGDATGEEEGDGVAGYGVSEAVTGCGGDGGGWGYSWEGAWEDTLGAGKGAWGCGERGLGSEAVGSGSPDRLPMPDGRLETLLRPDEKPVGNGMPVSKAVRSCRPESPPKSVGKGREGMEKGKEKGSGNWKENCGLGTGAPDVTAAYSATR
jgi:hypothetical protein